MTNDLAMRASAEAWAIWQPALQLMLMGERVERPDIPDADWQIIGEVGPIDMQAATRPGPKSGRVARIPVMGSISRRASFWSLMFGGTSVDGLTKALHEVALDDTIGTVLLDIDSPGGTVSGLPELAAEVRKLRESKHVVALANSLTASAAYWIASQADEIVATPEALVGSVGVFSVHEDWSKAMDRIGVKTTYIHAGKFKVEGNPDEPLTPEARDHMQAIVDDAYRLFVADVARGRGISPADVRSKYGEGRVLTAIDAKAAGMVDRIAGFDETVRRLSGVRGDTPTPALPRDDEAVTVEGADPATAAADQEEGEHTGSPQHLGNSLAAKRLRLELLEKS